MNIGGFAFGPFFASGFAFVDRDKVLLGHGNERTRGKATVAVDRDRGQDTEAGQGHCRAGGKTGSRGRESSGQKCRSAGPSVGHVLSSGAEGRAAKTEFRDAEHKQRRSACLIVIIQEIPTIVAIIRAEQPFGIHNHYRIMCNRTDGFPWNTKFRTDTDSGRGQVK